MDGTKMRVQSSTLSFLHDQFNGCYALWQFPLSQKWPVISVSFSKFVQLHTPPHMRHCAHTHAYGPINVHCTTSTTRPALRTSHQAPFLLHPKQHSSALASSIDGLGGVITSFAETQRCNLLALSLSELFFSDVQLKKEKKMSERTGHTEVWGRERASAQQLTVRCGSKQS